MAPSALTDIPVIDVDTHVVEPPDLWSSRLPKKYVDQAPEVRRDENGVDAWYMSGRRLCSAASSAQAGWNEYPPKHPPTLDDADPRAWDPKRRLEWMDAYGIHAQLLYPNVAMFQSNQVQQAAADDELRLLMVQAYNDYQTDFASVAPGRFVPITTLPFWDIDATLAEIDRCAAAGHRGINFTQDPTAFGLPALATAHWDPMWASMQEKGLPVNFHIASGDTSLLDKAGPPEAGAHANYASMGVSFFMGNARTISQLVCGGVCHRFPDVNFVSVESGIGWIPFALDALDWQWLNCGVPDEHPEYDLLPSEYYQRQIFGCFWFEREGATYAIERLGADSILYETDFPHPTSMSPGPATSAIAPNTYIDEVLGDLPEADLRKILHDNAARIYQLD